MLCFIPFVRTILAAVPATLVALTRGPSQAVSVTLTYVCVGHFIEGNFITPMVQSEATSLPPDLIIVALASFSILFGPMGVLLAAPLSIADHDSCRGDLRAARSGRGARVQRVRTTGLR